MAGALPEMPCAPILELYGQRKRFPIPFGLKPLIEKMARGVIADQPANIYVYLASFMEDRMQQAAKEKADQKILQDHRKSWEVYKWSWEGASVLTQEDLAEFLEYLSKSHVDADHYATIIQSGYRGHQAREFVKGMRKSKVMELGLLPLISQNGKEALERGAVGETDIDKLEGGAQSSKTIPGDGDKLLSENEEGGAKGDDEDSKYSTEQEEEESDLDSRTYEIEDEQNDIPGMGTTDEEQEESLSLGEAVPDTNPDADQETPAEQEMITLLAPISDSENKVDPAQSSPAEEETEGEAEKEENESAPEQE